MSEERKEDLTFVEGILFGTARSEEAILEGRTAKVFDWQKAASIIRDRQPKRAEAGLNGDWGCTGGVIYDAESEDPTECGYTYLMSLWATPQLEIDGERIDCFVYDTPETNPFKWDSDTQWPETAMQILREEET